MADAVELLKPLRDKLANNEVPDDTEITEAERHVETLDKTQKRQLRIEISEWIRANASDTEREHTRDRLKALAEKIPAADLVDTGLETGTVLGKRALEQPGLAVQNLKGSSKATYEAAKQGKWGEALVHGLEGPIPLGVVSLLGVPLIAKQFAAIGDKEGFFRKTGQLLKALLTTGLVLGGAVAAVNIPHYLVNKFRGEKPAAATA